MIVIVMGVCGSGKSSVGESLSKALNCAFAEADLYHSDANKEKMRNGIPLTDEDRWPWLLQLHDVVYSLHEAGALAVVTCSALRKPYRHVIIHGPSATGGTLENTHHFQHHITGTGATDDQRRGDIGSLNTSQTCDPSNTLAQNVIFAYLKASPETLQERMSSRCGHFMPQSLLKSQLEALEEPGPEELSLTVETTNKTVENVVAELQRRLADEYRLVPDT